MNMLNLAARICNGFSSSGSEKMRTVQKVKDNQIRDVVTALDMELHHISEKFVIERLPGCKFLSEECVGADFHSEEWCHEEYLVVDPLDGSNNHAMGLPNYGYMAAHLNDGCIQGSVIVLPEHHQYMVFQAEQHLYAQPLPKNAAIDYGTVYYAYPPKQDSQARETRGALMDLIDRESAGMYRYGSACAGLYQLLCGRHMAFIGHGIRIWDALAYFPVLAANRINVKYSIKGNTLTVLASKSLDFVDSAAIIIETQQGIILYDFCNDVLKVEAP
jgi:fructose-1,6-bisphosphatase/inositol monophosphatase family enzyme